MSSTEASAQGRSGKPPTYTVPMGARQLGGGAVAIVAIGALAVACGGAGRGTRGDDGLAAADDDGGAFEPTVTTSRDAGPQECAASSVNAQGAKVDLLFVIDSSGSMSQELAHIQQNVNAFAQRIGASGLDYTVTVITPRASSSAGGSYAICVPAPLGGSNCADNPPLFHQVSLAVGSNNSLSLIESTYRQWQGNLRADAYKVFVEVTDDESSTTADAFDQWLLTQTGGMFGTLSDRRYIFDSIVGWQDGTPLLSSGVCSTAMAAGKQYQTLSKLTNGIVDSVCKTDYGNVLNNLARGLVTRLGCEFQVPSSPDGTTTDPTKVQVRYTPATGSGQTLTHVTDQSKCSAHADGWYYDDNGSPTHIVLCAGTCSTIGESSSGKLDILVGCKAPAPK